MGLFPYHYVCMANIIPMKRLLSNYQTVAKQFNHKICKDWSYEFMRRQCWSVGKIFCDRIEFDPENLSHDYHPDGYVITPENTSYSLGYRDWIRSILSNYPQWIIDAEFEGRVMNRLPVHDLNHYDNQDLDIDMVVRKKVDKESISRAIHLYHKSKTIGDFEEIKQLKPMDQERKLREMLKLNDSELEQLELIQKGLGFEIFEEPKFYFIEGLSSTYDAHLWVSHFLEHDSPTEI